MEKDDNPIEAEVYYPDPNAPLKDKYNPCHIDHVFELDWAQHMFEIFASPCKCCSGVRVFMLALATLLAWINCDITKLLSVALFFTVISAIAYDNLRQ